MSGMPVVCNVTVPTGRMHWKSIPSFGSINVIQAFE